MKKIKSFHSLSFIKKNLRDINTAERELNVKKLNFSKEWNKWGKLKKEQD